MREVDPPGGAVVGIPFPEQKSLITKWWFQMIALPLSVWHSSSISEGVQEKSQRIGNTANCSSLQFGSASRFLAAACLYQWCEFMKLIKLIGECIEELAWCHAGAIVGKQPGCQVNGWTVTREIE